MSHLKAKIKVDFDWDSAPDLTGELPALPRRIAGFKGVYF